MRLACGREESNEPRIVSLHDPLAALFVGLQLERDLHVVRWTALDQLHGAVEDEPALLLPFPELPCSRITRRAP